MSKQYFLQQIGKRVFVVDEKGNRHGNKTDGYKSFKSASSARYWLINARQAIVVTYRQKREMSNEMKHFNNI